MIPLDRDLRDRFRTRPAGHPSENLPSCIQHSRSTVFAAVLSLTPLTAQNLAPSVGQLLRDHPGAVDPIAEIDQSLAWSRPVDVDMDLLTRLDPTGGDVADIELRPGLAYRALFERREIHEFGGISWIGSLEGLPGSRFFLSIADGHVAATFRPNTQDPALGGGQEATALVSTTILTNDLLSGRAGSGGYTLIPRKVGPVSIWNHAGRCDNLSDALTALRSDTNVAQLRDRYQADLVQALVGDLGTSCHSGVAGRAYIGDGVRSDLGFGVNRAVDAPQIVPHEVGHNLGCQHQGTSCSTYSNARQMICSGRVRRTRMWATLGSEVIGFFSNPDYVPSNCTPFGFANCADNARRIGELRQGVANFRGGSFASSSSYGSGWPGQNGIPSLTARSRPEPGTTLTLRVVNSRGGVATSGVLLLGVQRENLPTPFGGNRLVNPLIQETIPIAAFRGDTNLPLPANRSLCGTTWHSQVVMLDPGASAGLSFTQGLTLNLGR